MGTEVKEVIEITDVNDSKSIIDQTAIEFLSEYINLTPFEGEFREVNILKDFEIHSSGEPIAITKEAIIMKIELNLKVQKAKQEYKELIFKYDPLKFPEEIRNKGYQEKFLTKKQAVEKSIKELQEFVQTVKDAHELSKKFIDTPNMRTFEFIKESVDGDLRKSRILYEMSQMSGVVAFNSENPFRLINDNRIYEDKTYLFITLDGKEVFGQVQNFDANGNIDFGYAKFQIGKDGWLFDLEEMTRGTDTSGLALYNQFPVEF